MIPEGLPTMEVLVQHKMEAICLKPGRFQPNPWLGRGVCCAVFFVPEEAPFYCPRCPGLSQPPQGPPHRQPATAANHGFEAEKQTLRSNPRNPLSNGWVGSTLSREHAN